MKRFKYLVLTLCFTLTWPAFAAPLFPDVPDNHWAKDAVAALAAKGLVEGYPDGTFKGDRSASRWETAMIVARLLAKMEQAHATFATKAELDELRKLVNALKEELGALGVRVENLEEDVELIDQRVTELERISFYGYLDTRVAFQSFQNGSGSLNAMRSLNPGINFNNINYNAVAGSAAGAGGAINAAPFTGSPALGGVVPPGQGGVVPTSNPFTTGVLGLTNWRTGRPLTSGTGFTARAVLGMDIEVSDTIDAGIEFSAYTSQGDAIVDAYYGAQQPYLSNPFTASGVNGGSGIQSQNRTPFTNMTLDKFWVRHNPSGTKLIVGAYDEHDFNDSVYKGMLNPNEYGPTYLENYGFLVDGAFYVDSEEDIKLKWQVMGTILPDGSTGPVTPGTPGFGTNYFSRSFGYKMGFEFHEERGHVDFNFLHTADEATGGGALTTGLIQTPNLSANLQWVNPNGFFINQIQAANGVVQGIGGTGDRRPIPTNPIFGADGSLASDVAAGLLPQGVPNVGGIGPQQQTTYGIAADYTFDHDWSPKIFGEYAHSDYRPNKNSPYTAEGDAWKVGASVLLLDGDLALEGSYLSVDPRFSPFIIQMPTVGGISTPLWHTPGFDYYQNLFSLHNTKELPHNREGFRLKATWKYLPTGRITVEYGNLDQKTSSAQDVRFSQGSLGFQTPNTPVLGFSPGWIEPLFGGYHAATFAPSGGNALGALREDNKGSIENLFISGGYKWLLEEDQNNRGVTLSGGIKTLSFDRSSNMQAIGAAGGFAGAGTQAQNQNLVDLGFTGWHAQVDYDVTETFKVHGGFTQVDIKGHYDPFNTGGLYAESVGTGNYDNIDITQTWPEVGFEWDIEDDLTWGATARYFQFKDNIPSYVFTNPSVGTLNIQNGPQTAHPFNWEGVQLTSHLNLKF